MVYIRSLNIQRSIIIKIYCKKSNTWSALWLGEGQSSCCHFVSLCLSLLWHHTAILGVLLMHRGEGNGTHSSPLAWKIPGPEEPVRLQPMGLRRVGQDWATSLLLFTFMHWRRQWQPTAVFLPGDRGQGQRSLVGCRLWGRTESEAI